MALGMDFPFNEAAQWLLGPGALIGHYFVMKHKVESLEKALEDRTGKLERQADTDTKLLMAFTRVETKLDALTERVERLERKVLNGD